MCVFCCQKAVPNALVLQVQLRGIKCPGRDVQHFEVMGFWGMHRWGGVGHDFRERQVLPHQLRCAIPPNVVRLCAQGQAGKGADGNFNGQCPSCQVAAGGGKVNECDLCARLVGIHVGPCGLGGGLTGGRPVGMRHAGVHLFAPQGFHDIGCHEGERSDRRFVGLDHRWLRWGGGPTKPPIVVVTRGAMHFKAQANGPFSLHGQRSVDQGRGTPVLVPSLGNPSFRIVEGHFAFELEGLAPLVTAARRLPNVHLWGTKGQRVLAAGLACGHGAHVIEPSRQMRFHQKPGGLGGVWVWSTRPLDRASVGVRALQHLRPHEVKIHVLRPISDRTTPKDMGTRRGGVQGP